MCLVTSTIEYMVQLVLPKWQTQLRDQSWINDKNVTFLFYLFKFFCLSPLSDPKTEVHTKLGILCSVTPLCVRWSDSALFSLSVPVGKLILASQLSADIQTDVLSIKTLQMN